MDDGAARSGSQTGRRLAIDLAILIAIGLLMGFIGAFGSDLAPVVERYLYWMISMVGGGLIGVALDELLAPRLPALWRRVGLVSVLGRHRRPCWSGPPSTS